MADVTWQDVLVVAPTLASKNVSPDEQSIFVNYANEKVNPESFGGEDDKRLHLARCYLAAHFAAVAATQGILGSTGPTTSQSEGSVSQSFAMLMTPLSSLLASTMYGRMYLLLVSESGGRAGFLA